MTTPTPPTTDDLAQPLRAGAMLFEQKAQKEAQIAQLQADIDALDADIQQLALDIGPLSQQLQVYVQSLGATPPTS